MTKKKVTRAPLITLALVFLFNPNIQIIDLLPDFVSYFIIVRLLEKPAIQASYFAEARSASLKLAFISLAKIPAFMLAVFIRSGNTLDSDVFPMLSLIFAALEIIFSIVFIKNLSSAFFHLGERGTAAALITPFPLSKSGKRTMRPEDLTGFAIFFTVAKAALYVVPEFLLLSRTAENGTITPAPLSRYYPLTLTIALLLGFIIGFVWLSRSKKYMKAILSEGEFTNSLNFLASEDTDFKYETKLKLHSIKSSLSIIAIAAFFTLHVALQETEQINIFPGFIFGVIFLFALFKLRPHTEKSFLPVIASGTAYLAASVTAFTLSAKFLTKYDYINLISNKAVKNSYIGVVVTSGIEFVLFLVLIVFATLYLASFITENTGVSPKSDRYSRTELEYHGELKQRLYIFSSLAALTALLKFINVLLYLGIKISYSDANGIISPVTSSAIPWFGVVLTISAVAFIGYAIYFTRLLSEETDLKYKAI